MLVNVADYEAEARERLDPGVFGYIAGGAADELTMQDNLDAFARRHLRPRMLVAVDSVSTETAVLGESVSMPVLVAPTGFQRLVHPDGEIAAAAAASEAGTIYCLPTLSSLTPAELAEAVPGSKRWFQLYWSQDRGFTRELVAALADARYGALVLTIDLASPGRRERDLRASYSLPEDLPLPNIPSALGTGDFHAALSRIVDASLTWADLEWLRSACPLPLVLKGVLTSEDALLAAEHGAAAVIVSNHGGRQLDGVQASLDAVPEVVEAVGDRIEVLMDGGVRRGTDVVKALALGAKAVLVGRPALWGLAASGQDGVRDVLGLLRDEVELALRLLGCATPADVTQSHVG